MESNSDISLYNGYKEIFELLLRQEGIDVNMKDILNRNHS